MIRDFGYIPNGDETFRDSGFIDLETVVLPEVPPAPVKPPPAILTPKKIIDPWQEGYEIGNSGLPVYDGLKMILERDNPYPKNSSDFEMWRRGHRAGFDDLCEMDKFIPPQNYAGIEIGNPIPRRLEQVGVPEVGHYGGISVR